MFKVAVRCLTYNHSKFINEALNGFVIQKTNFPYLVLVIDDASTDGEQAVIKKYVNEHFDIENASIAYEKETEYANISYAQHKTNKNCYIVVHYLKYNHYQLNKKKVPYLAEWRKNVMYEALCEGDDYWTDPLKLQKQVDFLDDNDQFKLCYTDFNLVDENSNIIRKSCFANYPDKYPRYFDLESFVVSTGYMCPPSWLYRIDALPQDGGITSVDGTFVLFSHFLSASSVHCLDDITCVYRLLPESASHSKNPHKLIHRHKGLLETKIALIAKYNLSDSLIDNCKRIYYRDVLMLLVFTDNLKELDQYRNFDGYKSMKDKLILMFSKCQFGRFLLKQLYLNYSKLINK